MLNIYCADVCLPEYWTGHHRPHVAISVWKEMTFADVLRLIWKEYMLDAIAGEEPLDCTDDEFREALERYIKPSQTSYDEYFFLPGFSEDLEDNYAYFIIMRN